MLNGLFIQYLQTNPRFFFAIVISAVISIVLHELSHGIVAIWLGDDTPKATGHMTPNPFVHMGGVSLLALFFAGIAWGSMPISPHRLRGRHAEALVAAAGPFCNLLLSFLALTALALWIRYGSIATQDSPKIENLRFLLRTFGYMNLVLCFFNLLPVPPLDGSHILANYSRRYASLIDNPANRGLVILLFILAFSFSTGLFDVAMDISRWYMSLFVHLSPLS